MSAQIYSFPEPSSKLKIKTTMKGHAVSFNQERWTYGKTEPLAICHDALHKLKGVAVTIPGSYYWSLD